MSGLPETEQKDDRVVASGGVAFPIISEEESEIA